MEATQSQSITLQTKVNLADTTLINSLVRAYIQSDDRTKPLVNGSPNLRTITEQIELKEKDEIDRTLLVNALYKQYENIKHVDAVKENIIALGRKETFCITTAHQPNLLGGPMYFVYKALSTIKLVSICKSEFPQYHFVPVFWLGSEDHDVDELNHFYAYGRSFQLDPTGKTGAFGRADTKEMLPQLDVLFPLLGSTANSNELRKKLNTAYRKQPTIAKATHTLINELFGKYGMVVIDGDDADLKRAMIPLFARELEDGFVKGSMSDSLSYISREFGKIQARPRDINLFYLTNDFRERIVKEGDQYTVNNTEISFSKDEIIADLNQFPERYSPNVLVRPLMQERILPNIAYVGGGGELSYWLQLKNTFTEAATPFPVQVLRDSALLLEEADRIKLKKLNLDVGDVFQPQEELIRSLVFKLADEDLSLTTQLTTLKESLDGLHEKAERIDSSLIRSLEAEKARLEKSFKRLEKKFIRAEKRKQCCMVGQVERLYGSVFPHGKFQERYVNFTPFYVRFGDTLFDALLSNFNPLDVSLKIFAL